MSVPESTPSQSFHPSDEEARGIIRDNLNETLFVEASAGTGKTSSLVARIVNLVKTGRTTLDRIAAITFTEAAAAELRDRIRQQLERAAEEQGRDEVERSRCRQGVADLDQAAIRTLHSFAALLLHERPLEASLPPAFETTNAIAAGIKFNEAWNAWLDDQLDEDSALAPHLALALTLSMTLPQLRETALEFHENYADLERVVFDEVSYPPSKAADMLVEATPELARLCQFSKLGDSDRLYNHVQAKLVAMRRQALSKPGQLDACRLMRRVLPLRYGRGRQSDWEVDPETGQNACSTLKSSLEELHEAASEELEQMRRAVLRPILEGLRDFALGYARQRRAEGRAEFNDLLVWARQLLRDNLEVRDHFRLRFSHLLVDEAQDTDPIQAEIAMFLAEGVAIDVEGGSRATSWDETFPEEGKLFVVGDQKQSIYRFRRADVVQMNRLRQLMESKRGRTVSLVQNFRSQQPIIDWVNHLFSEWMGKVGSKDDEEYVQASYEHMSPQWSGASNHAFRPAVWALADEATPGTADEIRQQESNDIAALLRQIVAQGWQILDRDRAEATGRETYRNATFSDICILMPTRTGLRPLERGLEAHNIPYRLESASLIFDTQEIRDLLNCLRSVDNPADEVATVASLRSVAFGCSDIDLLQHYEGGGSFDYMRDSALMAEGPVSESLNTLRAFHEERTWEPVGTLIDRFLRDRQLMEASVGHPRMREQWRRYRFMVEQAWQFAAVGGNSLRSFVNWVEDQITQNARVTEAPVPEYDEDSVRIMTVHAAKGLEFPIVILTGLNAGRRYRADTVLFDRAQQRIEVGIGNQSSKFATAGHAELAEREKKMSEAEHVRLMYVATTRARDHLVLSLRRNGNGNGNTSADAISSIMEGAPHLWRPVTLDKASPTPDIEPEDNDGQRAATLEEHSVAARDRWEEERRLLLKARSLPASAAAASLGRDAKAGQEDKPEHASVEPWRKGRAGTSVGRAVHAVLQAVDLSGGPDIADRARAQALAEGIPSREDDVLGLCRAALESEVVKRAVSSGRLWREVPVAVATGGGSLHGFIDLLFEEEDGLVVVDYKTDYVSGQETSEAVGRYRLQGGAYAHAVQLLTGKAVKEVVFLYLQPKREERLPDLDQAMQEARNEAENLLGAPII